MEDSQNHTVMEPRHQKWIDFCAMGGLTIDADGQIGKKTAEALAKELKVARRTLYDWQDSIPNFWDHVKARRNELYGRDAVTLIYKAMLKKAATGDVAAAKLVLNQARMLEADRQDITSNGKALPTPILMGLLKDEENNA